ncbi:enoyl-CoA hydratase/isomerase family protein [Nocardioides humi]|uniref:Enoyl-CoA hydratase n=1 Tax=Nocardioides humi TaxID=449461 RepID=A0ABN2BXI3_9ACTN|nr:enoyl-CoA hydratase/isomerase family protein [Nocardioides humi]
MTQFEFIQVVKRGPVLECWLNRPEARNALSTAVEDEWDDVLELAAGDDSIKVVTLQGRGPVFSAGADMKEFAATFEDESAEAEPDDAGPVEILERPHRRHGASKRLWPPPAMHEPSLPRSWYFHKTLIAGVHGFVGPYAQRMLAPFDFIIAAEGTRFSWEQARMGSQNHPLAVYSFQLPMRVLKQLLLMGGWFDAETAHQLSLVQRVVSQDALPDEVSRWAEAASGLRLETISAYKEGIHRMYEIMGLHGMIGIGNNLNAHAEGSRGGDFHGTLRDSGMTAALAKRNEGVDPALTQVTSGGGR